MATRPTLPYFASPDSLPAPLPSVVDILASTQFFTSYGPSKVVRVGEHFVVKYGPRVKLQEGENMLFVQQSTNIRVPTVYALFNDQKTQNNFIVQEYIPGRTLSQVWKDFDQSDKEATISQLRQYVNELRALSSPDYFGGVWRQPVLDFYLTGGMDEGPFPPVLPCETEEEWVEAMAQRAQEVSRVVPSRFQWLKRMLHATFQGHNSVFTHCDLNRKNILVCDDKTLVLIDWEFSGWYPSCWEYCSSMIVQAWDDDWPEWIPQFLQEWPIEMGWMINYRVWHMFNSLQ